METRTTSAYSRKAQPLRRQHLARSWLFPDLESEYRCARDSESIWSSGSPLPRRPERRCCRGGRPARRLPPPRHRRRRRLVSSTIGFTSNARSSRQRTWWWSGAFAATARSSGHDAKPRLHRRCRASDACFSEVDAIAPSLSLARACRIRRRADAPSHSCLSADRRIRTGVH